MRGGRETGWAGLCLIALLSGCAHGRGDGDQAAAAPAPVPQWQDIATPADRERIRNWYQAWKAGLEKARTAGFGAAIAKEGPLLQPIASQADPALPAGEYACRIIKLGSKGQGGRDYASYPPFHCAVAQEGNVKSFTKETGSQRPVGLLLPDNNRRQIFLGTMVLGDEHMALDYGADNQRDIAGIVERIGPKTWRMTLPYPAFESLLDVVEITPAA